MPSAHIHINPPEHRNHFLWKYIDLHQLIFFLREGSLFFNRLDKFEDPFEGITTSIIKNEVDRLKKSESKIRMIKAWLKTEGTAAMQKKQFVNCWFNNDRESMAMWNLFSNPDSVAIRIKFDEMLDSLPPSFIELTEEFNNNIEVIGDKIHYLKLNPFDLKQNLSRLSHSALRKDIAFEHEKEYRFLIMLRKKVRKNLPYLKLKLHYFPEMKFEIITHPQMETWKQNNILPLLDVYGLPFKVHKSEIKLK